MTGSDASSRRRRDTGFEVLATLLIGIVAVLAAVFAIEGAHFGMAGTRAQVLAARLTADAAAKSTASSIAFDAGLRGQQEGVVVSMSGVSRQLAGTLADDAGTTAVGGALEAAGNRLRGEVVASSGTSGGPPLDDYAAGLVTASTGSISQEVREQGRQVDIATEMGNRQLQALFGLSLVTLAGVLAGVAAVLRGSRAGWSTLLVAWGIGIAAGAVALAALV